MSKQRQHTGEDYWPKEWMCIAEFLDEAQKIRASCAPGSAKAKDEAISLMTRCLRKNGYGPGLDLLLASFSNQKITPVTAAGQAAAAIQKTHEKGTEP